MVTYYILTGLDCCKEFSWIKNDSILGSAKEHASILYILCTTFSKWIKIKCVILITFADL